MNRPLFWILSSCALLASPPEWKTLELAGHWKRLRTTLEQHVRTQPRDVEALILLSRARGRFKDGAGAQAAARLATELAPQSADAWARRGQALMEVPEQDMGLMGMLRMAKEARQHAEKALALDPRHREALELAAGLYDQPGLLGGDQAKVKAFRATLATLDPDAGHRAAIDQALKARDTARLDAALKKARLERPKEVWPCLRAAQIYLSTELGLRAAEAEQAARAALALAPTDAKAMGLAAAACAAQGQWKEVDALLARNEKENPDDLQGHFHLGLKLLQWNRELGRAEACFRRYLGQEPEGGAPGREDAHWRLGLVLEKQGRKAEAVEQLRIALKCNPAHRSAKADLKRLT